MAFSSAELLAMETAYARGATKVKHGDKEVTYGSMEDLWNAILRMRRSQASPRYMGGVVGYKRDS